MKWFIEPVILVPRISVVAYVLLQAVVLLALLNGMART